MLERGFLDAIIGARPITMGLGKDGPESIELEHLSHAFDGANDPRHHGRRQRSNSISDDEDVDGTQLYSPIEERAVIRKLDRRLVLFVALLYMLSFLDRSSKSC